MIGRAFAAVVAVAALLAAPAAAAPHTVSGARVAVFGDSITAGTYLDFTVDAWPAVVAERLDIDVENRGVGGSLLHNAWPSIPNRLMIGDAVDAAIAEWGANVPDAVVLAGGANDMIEHRADAPYPADLQSQEHPRWALVHIMWRLQAAGVSNIYFLTLTPRAEGTLTDAYPTWPGILQERTASFNAWLRAGFPTTVIDTRGHFGDVRSGLSNTAFYVGDGLHPNSLGHRVIGDRVASFLRGRL